MRCFAFSRFALSLCVPLVFCVRATWAQVDSDLGILSSGFATVLSGTTTGRSNDIDTYSTVQSTLLYDQDFIYRFTVPGAGTFSLTSDDPDSTGRDNDFFLLSSLATTPTATGARQATAITAQNEFGQVTVSGSWRVPSAGTYFLSIDAFRGNPAISGTPATGRAGAFNASVSFALTTVTTPTATQTALDSAGTVTGNLPTGAVFWSRFDYGGTGGFTLDTFGTEGDTALALYNAAGYRLALNDDAEGTGTLQSQIVSPSGLGAGTYYLALGAFDTTFGDNNFAVTPGTESVGDFVLNGLSVVPETGTGAIVLLGAGCVAAGLITRRRLSVPRAQ